MFPLVVTLSGGVGVNVPTIVNNNCCTCGKPCSIVGNTSLVRCESKSFSLNQVLIVDVLS